MVVIFFMALAVAFVAWDIFSDPPEIRWKHFFWNRDDDLNEYLDMLRSRE